MGYIWRHAHGKKCIRFSCIVIVFSKDYEPIVYGASSTTGAMISSLAFSLWAKVMDMSCWAEFKSRIFFFIYHSLFSLFYYILLQIYIQHWILLFFDWFWLSFKFNFSSIYDNKIELMHNSLLNSAISLKKKTLMEMMINEHVWKRYGIWMNLYKLYIIVGYIQNKL